MNTLDEKVLSPGDIVSWKSHGRGVYKEKIGKIVVRLNPGQVVDEFFWASLRIPECRTDRRKGEVSYIIRCEGPESTSYYWPKTRMLKLVRRARKSRK